MELLLASLSYLHLKHERVLLPDPGISLLEFSGEDRKEWLQGQVTNDLRNLRPGGSISFCICTPTGQILTVADAWELDDRILISIPTQTVEDVLRRVDQMVVMEDVSVSVVSGSMKLFSLQGPTVEQPSGMSCEAEILCLSNDRTGFGGIDIWAPDTAVGDLANFLSGYDILDKNAWHAARIEAGIPRFGIDINPKTLPPELGPAFEAQHVSYTKGCYTGQEVLMRIHSRGHTNRIWTGIAADSPMEVGACVESESRSDAGVVTTVAASPEHGYIAAAMLRTEAAEPGSVVTVLTSNGPLPARVASLPME